jgi:hypothetical protein
MAKGGESLWDVARHGDVHMAIGVVPIECEPKVRSTCPVFGESISCGKQSVKEVLGVGFRKIFDAKVVNSEGKGCGPCGVTPEAWSVGNRVNIPKVQGEYKVVCRPKWRLL